MAGRLLIPGWNRALDSDGDPISARISLFLTGTDDLASVYSDEALTIPLTNPVESNSAGRFPAIWADDAVTYDWSVEAPYGPPGSPFTGIGLTTALAADVLAAEAAEAAADNAALNAAQTAADLAAIQEIEAAGSTAPAIAGKLNRDGDNADAALLGNIPFLSAGTGAVSRSAQAKLADRISPKDFGAALDGTTDDTAAIQAALTYAATRPRMIVDMGGGTAYCGPITFPNNSVGLGFKEGGFRVKGDAHWLSGAPGATSITFPTFDNVYIDASEQTTPLRRTIDFSLFTYGKFGGLRFFNNNLGTQHNLFVAGSVAVGPYYNVFDDVYSGGALAAVYIAPAASVSVTANNNTFTHCRFQPGGPGRYGAIVGDKNQQNRFFNTVFEDTAGGIGIDDDGIGTQMVGCRFESMTTAINFGANAAGGADIGCHFDSNGVKRVFAGSAEAKHNIIASHNGDGSTDDAIMGLGLKIGGGLKLRGDPGFPGDLATGQGFEYSSATLGHAWGGYGSTNDNTELNRLGQIVSANPTGTLNKSFAGSIAVAGTTTSTSFLVGANQVVGARGAALPADATDLATALTLVNAIKARMIAHGLVAP